MKSRDVSTEEATPAAKPMFVLLAEDRTAEEYSTLYAVCERNRWDLTHASDPHEAMQALGSKRFGVIITEPLLTGGESWHALLADMLGRPCPWMVIVASRLADEALWAEVLNLGGHDVLAKPFDEEEVERVLSAAWRHLCKRNKPDT